MAAIIDDGYTLDGHIAPVPGIHEGLTFTYRPMTKRQLAAMESRIRKAKDDDEGERVAAETIAAHVTTWDAKNSRDDVAAVTAENVLNMQTLLNVALFNIVRGYRANDAKPEPDPAKNL